MKENVDLNAVLSLYHAGKLEGVESYLENYINSYIKNHIELDSLDCRALNALASIKSESGDNNRAIEIYKIALGIDSSSSDAQYGLIKTYFAVGEIVKADAVMKPCLSIALESADFSRLVADVHSKLGRATQALQFYTSALVLAEKNAFLTRRLITNKVWRRSLEVSYAESLKAVGQFNKAEEYLRSVVARDTGSALALNALGKLYVQQGEFDKAEAIFERSIESFPRFTAAYYELHNLRGRSSTLSEIAAMEKLSLIQTMPKEPKVQLHFALSRAYESVSDYDKSFLNMTLANQLMIEPKRSLSDCYVDRLSGQQAPAEFFPADKQQNVVPLFIVGMPRSGTSLLDQALSAHSGISSRGEVGYIDASIRLLVELTGKEFPACMSAINDKIAQEVSSYYLSSLLGDGKEQGGYLTDKSPMNFQYLGFIKILFPNAKIIYCHREAIANCFSIYRLPFDKEHFYAHDLSQLARFYLQHHSLMRTWFDRFGDDVLSVSYENVVDDFESEINKVLAYLSLDYEAPMKEFYKYKRFVNTPSANQVREPIYKDSVEAWRNYEKHLSPLINHFSVD